jgi:hypothetical protein
MHLFRFHRADGVAHDQDGSIGRVEGFPLGLGQRLEGMGDDGDGRLAALLDFN